MDISINNTYSAQYTKYFDYAIMTYAVFYAVKNSQLDYYSLIRLIKQFFFVLSVSFSFLSIIRNFKWNAYTTLCFTSLTLIPLYLKLHTGDSVLVITLLIMAAYNIPFHHVTKKCMHAICLVLFIVLFSAFIGLVEDRLYYRDVDNFENSYAHDLGFRYYGYYAYLGMGIVQCLIYRWHNNMNFVKIISLFLLSYLFFLYSSTRLQMYSCVAFLGCVLVLPIIPKFLFNNRLTGFLSLFIYPVICLVLYYVSKYSVLSLFLDNFDELNRMTSGRLRLNEEAFMYYDANLWGNILEFDTELGSDTYFYVDSGYLHTLLESGIIYTGLIMLLYSILFYKVYKAKAYFLFIWLALYSLICISNGLLTSILANPILLLAFSDIDNIRYDYELDFKKRKERKRSAVLVSNIM
ncbi:MAG: hypothetical protein IJ845_02760 [Bacteroidaceae bacterium]|nr:hypothetical protein [Bacteroidaceae bacterium]